MTKVGGTALALITAVVALVVMAWFDTTVVHDAAQQAAQTFDSSQYTLIASVGMILIAGAVLLLASLAWRSGSVAVGILYVAVGAYFAFQMWIWTNVPAVLPDPLVSVVSNISYATVGPLNAVGVVGGGMLIAGVAVLTWSFRERPGASAPR